METKGGMAIIIARFIPFARTFVPIVAGISSMKYPRFLMYNVVGAMLWAIGLRWQDISSDRPFPISTTTCFPRFW